MTQEDPRVSQDDLSVAQDDPGTVIYQGGGISELLKMLFFIIQDCSHMPLGGGEQHVRSVRTLSAPGNT